MNKVKVKNIKTGVIKEINKSLAGDYVGTGDFVLVEEKEQSEEKKQTFAKPSFVNIKGSKEK
jgi:hypothetical protein